MPDEMCNCEHEAHFQEQAAHTFHRVTALAAISTPIPHGYQAVPAGKRSAQEVGPVCDKCADGHMAPYIRL